MQKVKMDFIHKLSIAQKECDETLYWLKLLSQTGYLNLSEFKSINEETEAILKMIRSSIITAKRNFKK